MSQGRVAALGVAFLVVAVALIALLYQSADPGEVEATPLPKAAPIQARPVPVQQPRPLRPPPRTEKPAPPAAPAISAESIAPEVRQDFNYAVRDATNAAQEQCIQPWLAEGGTVLAGEVTFVMDAVVTDGQLTDITLRGIGDIPDDVIDCIREAAWALPWPTFEGQGELRFQKSFNARQ